jgi:hypothetical protein
MHSKISAMVSTSTTRSTSLNPFFGAQSKHNVHCTKQGMASVSRPQQPAFLAGATISKTNIFGIMNALYLTLTNTFPTQKSLFVGLLSLGIFSPVFLSAQVSGVPATVPISEQSTVPVWDEEINSKYIMTSPSMSSKALIDAQSGIPIPSGETDPWLHLVNESTSRDPNAALAETECSCPGNLIQNASFENGTNNWSWWGGNLQIGNYAAICPNTSGNTGQMQITSSWGGVYQDLTGIAPGTILSVAAYAGTHDPGGYYVAFGVEFYTSSWNWISGQEQEVNAQLPSLGYYEVTAQVPSNAHYVRIVGKGNGNWIKMDAVCVTTTTCNPDNSTAPPFCAPEIDCPSGPNSFVWSQTINTGDGNPSTLRMYCGSTVSYTIPGPYPSGLTSGPVTVTITDAVSWDGYASRNTVTQPNERWRVIFKKSGSTIYTSPYTGDVPDYVQQGYWRGALGTSFTLPNGTDQIIIEHWSVANGCPNPNSVVPTSLCIEYSSCDNVTSGGTIGSNQTACGTSYDPALLTNVTAPSGGTGALEYLWLKSTTFPCPPVGDASWQVISGATSVT